MPRTCTICAHPLRREIEEGLVYRRPYRNIAEHYALSVGSLSRHVNAGHIAERLRKVRDEEDLREALDVARQLKAINSAAGLLLSEAMERDEEGRRTSPYAALSAIDRVQRQIELQAKLLGQIEEAPRIELNVHPEWVELRTVIVGALEPHPEALEDVLLALSGDAGAG